MTFLSPNDITQALQSIGLHPGETALVHCDAMVAAQLAPMRDEERLDTLIAAIEAALSPRGTLVMPAFTYSYTRDEDFDVLNSASRVGMLTERFRTAKNVCRTLDPIFSFAARGQHASLLCTCPVTECFGRESAFAALHELNCHIVCLGCSFTNGGTFTHYVEQCHQVDYRYNKAFPGTTITTDGQRYSSSVIYYVRDLNRNSGADLQRLQQNLSHSGHLRSATIGRIRITAVHACDFFDTAWQMLDDDPLSLIKEGMIEEGAVAPVAKPA